MNSIQKLKQALHTRINDDPDTYFTDAVWDDEVSAACENISYAIRFVEQECSDEELYWLGEVFDDIMDKSRNIDFLNALRERAMRVKNPQWQAEIYEDIQTAADYVEEDK